MQELFVYEIIGLQIDNIARSKCLFSLYFAAFLFLFLTTVVDHCPDAVLDGEPLVGVEPVAPRHTEGGAQ